MSITAPTVLRVASPPLARTGWRRALTIHVTSHAQINNEPPARSGTKCPRDERGLVHSVLDRAPALTGRQGEVDSPAATKSPGNGEPGRVEIDDAKRPHLNAGARMPAIQPLR